MKQVILALAVLFIGVTAIAQIPNGDFETWTETSKDQLKGWNKNGRHDKTVGPGNTNAVKLISENQGPGVIAYVNFQDDMENLNGGFAYKKRPAKLKVNMRYNIPSGDTGNIIMSFSAAGIPMSLDIKQIVGANTTFQDYFYDVTFFVPTIMPDSCVLGFTSGNIDGDAIDGGYLEISKVEFVDGNGAAMDPIPNGDFKDWEKVTTVTLDNWITTSDFHRAFGSGLEPVKRTTDRTGGNYALMLETVAREDDTSSGFAFVSKSNSLNFDSDGPNFKVEEKFLSMNGNYKYQPVGKDTCEIVALFYFGGSVVGSAQFESGMTSDTFMPFSVDINYHLSVTPDSASLFLFSSDPENTTTVGSKLWVDDLTFKSWLSSEEEVMKTPYIMYPNPTKGLLNLRFENGSSHNLRLLDMNGKLVLELEGVRNNAVLNLSTVSTGIYMLSIESNNEKYTEKVIVK